MDPLRILIAADHPLVRTGLSTILAGVPGLAVVGQATTGREAIDLATNLRPDVVVMDLQMPDVSGVTATREILDLLAAGRSNGQIARQLSLSPKTVANYTSTIFAKLQANDRAEAIIRAREAGLGQGKDRA